VSFIANIKRILHWRDKDVPQINLDVELYQQLKPFRLPLILTVLMVLFGTLGYILIDDFSLSDAVYQSGITFTLDLER